MIAGVLLVVSAVEGQRPLNPADQAPTLDRGKVVESELAGGETRSFRAVLQSGQHLSAVVEQRGIDVVVTVIGPDGKKIAEVDGPTGAQGPEKVEFAANNAGTYRLEVRPLEPKAARGRIAVKIDEILTAEQVKERTAAEQARADEAKQWLAKNAIPLRSVVAGRGFEDLQPLKKLIGPARLVALGEATHGTREFFQLKHRMLEFLVSEMGFTVFGIEATMPEGFDINEYVLAGKGDPAKALAGLYFWTWNTEEVLEMIRWMRSYNADPRHEKKVKFYGFDMQSPTRAAKVALNYARKVDPTLPSDLVQDLSRVANPFLAPSLRARPVDESKAATAALALLARFDQRKADYTGKSDARAWAVARQHAQILVQSLERSASGEGVAANKRMSARDRAMADNVGWILDHEGPDAKMVIWAHNGHVAADVSNGVEWMGWHLRKRFGDDLFVFGFAFNQGSFQAMEMPIGSGRGLRAFDVKPAPEGSLDRMLATAGLSLAAIDLKALPKDGPAATWFSQPRATRSIGAGFGDQLAENFVAKQRAPLLYDALLFVEKTTAARPNPTGKRGGTSTLLPPDNLDFERGEPGKPPIQWRGPIGLGGWNYDVATSDDKPHSGKRCGMIRSTPSPHYGETFGSLAQTVNAKDFHGRRVKLRAAVRTEVTGLGNQAHLWLRVLKSGANQAAVAFEDDMADRPITSREWRVFEIVGDVPKEATTITFGLALVGEGKAWLDSVTVEAVAK